MANSKNIKKFGFTLAEVLLTLSVIGVIASLTIPPFAKKYQDQQTVVKFKKAFSDLSQATLMINADCEGRVTNCLTDPNAANNDVATMTELTNLYKAKLKVLRDCGTTSPGTGCFGNEMYKNLNGADWLNQSTRSDHHKLLLTNGIAVSFNWDGASEAYGTYQGDIDINGEKPPNQRGRDTFNFLYNLNTGLLETAGITYSFSPCDDAATDTGGDCGMRILIEGAINY